MPLLPNICLRTSFSSDLSELFLGVGLEPPCINAIGIFEFVKAKMFDSWVFFSVVLFCVAFLVDTCLFHVFYSFNIVLFVSFEILKSAIVCLELD